MKTVATTGRPWKAFRVGPLPELRSPRLEIVCAGEDALAVFAPPLPGALDRFEARNISGNPVIQSVKSGEWEQLSTGLRAHAFGRGPSFTIGRLYVLPSQPLFLCVCDGTNCKEGSSMTFRIVLLHTAKPDELQRLAAEGKITLHEGRGGLLVDDEEDRRLPHVGDMWQSHRHRRRYRVLRFEGRKVILWDLTFCHEEPAEPLLMHEENGWQLIEKGPEA